MSSAEVSIQEIKDRLAIANIEGEYARLCDSGNGDLWANLFTENGVYQSAVVPGMPGATSPIRGRSELAESINNSPTTNCIHKLSPPQIDIFGDTATVHTNFEVEISWSDEHGNNHYRTMSAYYHVAYERVRDEWKIRNRVTVPFSVTTTVTCGYRSDISLPGPGN